MRIPFAQIRSVTREFGWVTGIVVIRHGHGEFRFRCFGAKGVAQQIADRLSAPCGVTSQGTGGGDPAMTHEAAIRFLKDELLLYFGDEDDDDFAASEMRESFVTTPQYGH